MHHVLFTDGEEALLDLGADDVELIECPTEAAAVAAAARAASKAPAPAVAAVARHDTGQRLTVFWPQDGKDGKWWPGVVTHVTETG